MLILRVSALRSVSGPVAMRPVARTIGRNALAPRLAQRTARRGYASHGDGHKKAGSDIPWLAGAIAVTIPGVWWGLSPSSGHGGGHNDHDDHDEGHAKHEDKEEAAPEEEARDDESEEESKEDKPEDEEESKEEGDEEKAKPQGKQDTSSTKDLKPENEKKDGNKDKNVGEGVTSEKSKKAPGVPAAAKVKGTVKSDKVDKS